MSVERAVLDLIRRRLPAPLRPGIGDVPYDAAATWVRDLAGILGENPYYDELQPVPGSDELEEGRVALSYLTSGAGSARAVLVAAPNGADVVRVQLVPSGRTAAISLDAVAELAAAQVACLEHGPCAAVTPSVATPVPNG